MARCAELQPGERVLDPMCGKAAPHEKRGGMVRWIEILHQLTAFEKATGLHSKFWFLKL